MDPHFADGLDEGFLLYSEQSGELPLQTVESLCTAAIQRLPWRGFISSGFMQNRNLLERALNSHLRPADRANGGAQKVSFLPICSTAEL